MFASRILTEARIRTMAMCTNVQEASCRQSATTTMKRHRLLSFALIFSTVNNFDLSSSESGQFFSKRGTVSDCTLNEHLCELSNRVSEDQSAVNCYLSLQCTRVRLSRCIWPSHSLVFRARHISLIAVYAWNGIKAFVCYCQRDTFHQLQTMQFPMITCLLYILRT